jgi:metal-responsive CopG/Arc/MetJ family transcriptional regulator
MNRMVIDIPQTVAERLERLAEKQGASIGDVLEALLDRYTEAETEMPRLSLAALAQNAREAQLASATEVDTAARSREILRSRG